VVVDLGAGAGELLAAVCDRRPGATGIGIDLSTAAAEYAARQYPLQLWIVANADRRLPLLDRSVDLMVSLHGRRNPQECARTLTKGGTLIVAFPAPDDLRELRAHLHGGASERERGDAVVAEHEAGFTVSGRTTVRERHRLNAESLRDLLRGTYRGARVSEAQRLSGLASLDLTVAAEVIVFRPRP
jgi:23S rRNA (guanine745-N1)-methyltransferase